MSEGERERERDATEVKKTASAMYNAVRKCRPPYYKQNSPAFVDPEDWRISHAAPMRS